MFFAHFWSGHWLPGCKGQTGVRGRNLARVAFGVWVMEGYGKEQIQLCLSYCSQMYALGLELELVLGSLTASITSTSHRIETINCSYSHIIHKTWIWHLLKINSLWHFSVGLGLYNPMLNHILEICKASPNIT